MKKWPLKNLFKKPEKGALEKREPYPSFRGRILYHPETCIGCRLCEKNCPADAVTFHKKGRIDYDMGKCVFCGLCRDVCPTKPKSIDYITEYDYSSHDKKKLTNRKE